MRRILLLTLIFLLITYFSPVSFAKEKIKIGFGNYEPHFMEGGKEGLFADLVKEVFKHLPQYELEYIYDMSNKRIIYDLNVGVIDVGTNIFTNEKIVGYKSDPIFRFTDVAVSLKDKNYVIKAVSDLKGKSIVTYQGAKIFLGEDFKKIVEAAPDYQEKAKPEVQAKLVALGRMDVSVGDIYVFLHSIKTWSKGKIKPEKFKFHRIFQDIYSHMGFKDKKLRDEFNVALKKIKENGRYEAIYQEYLEKLGFKE